jgi:hypothetical protein
MYTGQQIFADLKRLTSEYISDAINPAIGNMLLKKALFEQIEDNYHNLATQKNKDELGTLIKTRRRFTVYNQGINVNRLPITAITIPSANIYRITFQRPHHLGAGVTVRFADVLGITGINTPIFTFTAVFPNNNQYNIINENTIQIGVTGASGTWTADSGYMTSSNMITDYLHLLMAKTTFEQKTKYRLSSTPTGLPLKCTIGQTNNLRTEEKILFYNPTTLSKTPAYFIKKQLPNTFLLYTNKDLDAPAGSTIATNAFFVYRVYDEVCLVMNSDEKKTLYAPTASKPRVETTNKELIFYPLESNCTSVEVDYISTETKLIDVSSAIDYEMYYNRTFLDKMLNRAVQNAAIMFQSEGDYQMITANINQNRNPN